MGAKVSLHRSEVPKYQTCYKYPCLKCDMVFTSPSGLSTHLPKHEGTRFACPKCGKTYARKGYVGEHLKGACQWKPDPSAAGGTGNRIDEYPGCGVLES